MGTALGVMIAWRAYVKVVGLLGWWRAGREVSDKENEDWTYLYQSLTWSLGVAVGVCACCLVSAARCASLAVPPSDDFSLSATRDVPF